MSEFDDPGDLGLLLQSQQETLERLDARGVGIGPTDWVPDLFATTTKPGRGSNSIRVGEYAVSAEGWCTGYGDMRYQASMTRGSGVYLLSLPVRGHNRDPRGYTIIGSGVIGIGSTHTVFSLHFSGAANYRRTDRAVMAIEGSLFATDGAPAGANIGNIHYTFGYFIADPA